MLSGEERAVCELIAKRGAALLEDLRLHVGLPTGGGNMAALDETRERLTARARALGASVELVAGDPKPDWLHGVEPGGEIPPTAVCRRVEGKRGTRVLLSGHLDTVHDPDGDFRELVISSDGKTATGPGCVDMKGGLVITLGALEALEEAGRSVAWSLVLNSDEETGSYHSERALRAAAKAHDVALVVEPATTDGGLVIERAGSGQFVIETRGRSTHVGRDFGHGISAVTALAECLVEVAGMPVPSRGLIVNVGPIEGGVATNAVPDRARAWGNVRYPDAEGAEELSRMLDAVAGREFSWGRDGLPRVEVKKSFIRPAKPTTAGVRALAERARGVSEALGRPLPFSKTAGVCDGNILQDEGLACIDTLGVRGGGLHTPQEWIELASLVERCQMLAVLLMRVSEEGVGGAG